jgi:hypothetical protein
MRSGFWFRTLQRVTVVVATLGFFGTVVASSKDLTVTEFEGSYFSPDLDSGCHFGASVYHISNREMTFRSEGSEFELLKNISVTNPSENVMMISGIPDSIEIAGKQPKKLDIQFDIQIDQLVPITMFVDGEKFEPRQELVQQYTLRKCDNPSFLGSALLWLGINKEYSEEGFIRYKRGANGNYVKVN